MKLQPEVESIIRKVAKKYNLSYKEAFEMYVSTYEVLKKVISSAERERDYFPIVHTYFAWFSVKDSVRNYFKNFYAKKESSKNEEEKIQ